MAQEAKVFLKSLSDQDLKTLQGGLAGQKVDETRLKSIIKSMPAPVLNYFHSGALATAQDEADLLKETLSASTNMGQIKSMAKDAGKAVLGAVGAVGETYDRYAGAPIRAGIGAAQNGKNPISAYGSQFGEDPSLAPTGKDIASKAGLSTEEDIHVPIFSNYFGKVSPAGMAGLGVDIAADPMMVLPTGAITKGAQMAVKAGVGTAKAVGKHVVAPMAEAVLNKTVKAADILSDSNIASKTVHLAKGATADVVDYFAQRMKPTKAIDWEEIQAVAKKNDIPADVLPEQLEYGKNNIITRIGKGLAEGAQPERIAKHEQAIKYTNQALDNQVKKLSGGQVATPLEVGDAIKADYDQSTKELFDQIDFTYQSVAKQLPNLTVKDIAPNAAKGLNSSLTSMSRELSRRARLGVTDTSRAQASDLLKTVNNIQNIMGEVNAERLSINASKGQQSVLNKINQRLGSQENPVTMAEFIKSHVKNDGKFDGLITPKEKEKFIANFETARGNFQDLVYQLQELGREAFTARVPGAAIPPDIKGLQKLYFDVQKTIYDTVEKAIGTDRAMELASNNKLIHDFLSDKNIVGKALKTDNPAGEKVFEALIKNGNSVQLKAVTELISPETLQKARGAWLDSLLTPNIDGNYSFKTVFNNLNKNEQKFGSLFTPQERVDFHELLKLGSDMGIPIMSTSATGASNSLRDLLTTIPNAIASDTIQKSLKEIADGGRVYRTDISSGAKMSGPGSSAADKVKFGMPVILGGKRSPAFYGAKGSQIYSTDKQNEDNALQRAMNR